MAIAGVEPVKINYLEDDEFIENAWDEPNVQVHSGFPETFVGYTETQVREILIKFAESVSVSEDIEDAVDKFMKIGD